MDINYVGGIPVNLDYTIYLLQKANFEEDKDKHLAQIVVRELIANLRDAGIKGVEIDGHKLWESREEENGKSDN